MKDFAFTIRLPLWLVGQWEVLRSRCYSTVEERMQLAIELAEQNIDNATGGPFGAAIFGQSSHRLIAVGVNLVTSQDCSLAHAETVALALAQKVIGHYDLSTAHEPLELVTSVEPCAMCLGAIPWSGIKSVVCGACTEDAEAVGFDEGSKPARWMKTLTKRGIDVTTEILRDKARRVLETYKNQGQVIYHP